jgi:hypothetical protein
MFYYSDNCWIICEHHSIPEQEVTKRYVNGEQFIGSVLHTVFQ